jgi:hypothetical protein
MIASPHVTGEHDSACLPPPAWMDALQASRWELYQGGPDLDFRRFQELFPIDPLTIKSRCGLLWTRSIQFERGSRFDGPDDDNPGERAAIIECIAADGWTRVDLCAWPVDRPEEFALAFGHAEVLGADQIENPASYFGGHPMPVWRTPERWLQHGGEGAVLLNRTSAPRVLAAARGRLLAEDIDHGRELARLLAPFFDPKHILAPKRAAQRRAA